MFLLRLDTETKRVCNPKVREFAKTPKFLVPQISKFINQSMRPDEIGAVVDQRPDHVAEEIYDLREHSW